MDTREQQKTELDYIFDRLDAEGRRILLLFARKIPAPAAD